MKSIILLLFLFVGATAFGQSGAETGNTPPRKANKIIVLVKDSSNTLFDKLVLTLFDKGFAVDNKDEKLKIISTKERTMKKGNFLTKIQVRINDTAIVFTSTMALGFEMRILGTKMEQTYDPVTYSGLKGSYMRTAWNELDEIARKFGDKIVYSK
jgi:hypothetical protein